MSSLAGLKASSHSKQNVNAVPSSDLSHPSTFYSSCDGKQLKIEERDKFLAR